MVFLLLSEALCGFVPWPFCFCGPDLPHASFTSLYSSPALPWLDEYSSYLSLKNHPCFFSLGGPVSPAVPGTALPPCREGMCALIARFGLSRLGSKSLGPFFVLSYLSLALSPSSLMCFSNSSTRPLGLVVRLVLTLLQAMIGASFSILLLRALASCRPHKLFTPAALHSLGSLLLHSLVAGVSLFCCQPAVFCL